MSAGRSAAGWTAVTVRVKHDERERLRFAAVRL